MTTRSGHRENSALMQWYRFSNPFIVVFYPFTTTRYEVFHCPCSLSNLEYYPSKTIMRLEVILLTLKDCLLL